MGSNPTSSSSLAFGRGFFSLGYIYYMNKEDDTATAEPEEKKKIVRIPFTEELQESMFSFFQIVTDKLAELESRISLLEDDREE